MIEEMGHVRDNNIPVTVSPIGCVCVCVCVCVASLPMGGTQDSGSR